MEAEDWVSGDTSGGTEDDVLESASSRVPEVEALICDLVLTIKRCRYR